MTTSGPLLSDAPNFRDFGGHRTIDGRLVRRGRLFRSELLLNLGAQDLRTLAALRIGLVCDLRSPSERRHATGQWPAQSPAEVLALDPGTELFAVQPEQWSRQLADPAFDEVRAHEALERNYRRMPAGFAAGLGELFARLMRPDAPRLLVHCAAGKDRTGFVCAALLRALGVAPDTVMADYLVTGQRYTPDQLIDRCIRDLLTRQLARTERIERALRVLASVRPSFLDAAFDEIERNLGGLDTYLAQHCGLDASARQALQTALLQPG